MRKNEIKKAATNKVIVDYVSTYSTFVVNLNTGMGIKRASEHLKDLEEELLARGVLTEEDIKALNG